MSRRRERAAPAWRCGDDGSALVDFVVLVPLLLLPLVYLVLVLARLQAGAFAAQAAAGSAARAAAAARTEGAASSSALAAVDLAAADQGFDPAHVASTTACAASPCLTPGARITVSVVVQVDLPGVPALVRGVVPARVAVSASSSAAVDRFSDRSTGATGATGAAG